MVSKNNNTLRVTVYSFSEEKNLTYVKNFDNNIEEMQKVLNLVKSLDLVTTEEEYTSITNQIIEAMSQDINDRLSAKGGDIFFYDRTKEKIVIKIDDVIIDIDSEWAQERIEYCLNNNLSIEPLQKMILRALNNPNVDKKDMSLFYDIIKYACNIVVDFHLVEKLVTEEKYSENVAIALATVNEIPITSEGLLHVSKVVELDNARTFFEFTKKDGEVKKVLKSHIDVDPNHGNIIVPSDPSQLTFKPAIYSSGDKFGCGATEEDYVYRINQLAWLKSWSQVSVKQNNPGKGLWVGSRNWTKSYERSSNYTIECFVSPDQIGSVCGFLYQDGAIVVKELYPFRIKERGKENPAFYTSHSYGSDVDWNQVKENIKQKFV